MDLVDLVDLVDDLGIPKRRRAFSVASGSGFASNPILRRRLGASPWRARR